MRVSKEAVYIKMARAIALRSTCHRKQVGSIIVKEGRIISTGYNGYPSGMTNCTDLEECPEGPSCTYVIHAEANAILFAAKAGISVDGSTMYCTLSPCANCAKMIINSGITKVIYCEEYRDTTGIELLESCGVDTEIYISEEELVSVDINKTNKFNTSAFIAANFTGLSDSIKNSSRILGRSQKANDFNYLMIREVDLLNILERKLKDKTSSEKMDLVNLIKKEGL